MKFFGQTVAMRSSSINVWQRGRLAERLDGGEEVKFKYFLPVEVRVISIPFPHYVGWSDKIETGPGDRAFYARVDRVSGPGRRPIWGRFVRGKLPRETTHLTAVLRPSTRTNGWVMVAAYAGEAAPPFPGDPNEALESQTYWSRHALLDGTMPYQEDSVMTECPWDLQEVVNHLRNWGCPEKLPYARELLAQGYSAVAAGGIATGVFRKESVDEFLKELAREG